MSLMQFIASDRELHELEMIMTQSMSKTVGEYANWFCVTTAEDCWLGNLKLLFDKKYIVQVNSSFEFSLKQFFLPFYNMSEEGKKRAMELRMISHAKNKMWFQEFFNYIQKTLFRGENIEFYTIYNNEPNFIPKERVEIDLQTFVLPDEFGFDEDVLYILQN